MSVLGNILWFIFGGFLSGMSWIVAGCLWCISIIGIPVGLQCFKFAGLAFWPFGKEVIWRRDSQPDCQYHLADRIGNSNGSRKCIGGCCVLHYDYRNTFWKTVFQDCEVGADAVWSRGQVI